MWDWLHFSAAQVEVGALLAFVGYLLALAAVPRLLLERRESTATLAWLLAIVFLPYLGLLLFWLIGERRIRRTKRRKARADRQLTGSKHDVVGGALARFERPGGVAPGGGPPDPAMVLADRVTGAPATIGNRVTLLVDGVRTFETIAEAIRAARDHVHLEYYIFARDRTGTRFRDLLIERCRAGVEVRLLYDHVGSFSLNREFLAPLRDAGGKVGDFLPVFPLARKMRVNLRNHRKIVVVDGRVGFTGGINVGDDYAGAALRRGRWRDTHARLEGPAVARLQEVFAEDWHFTTGEDLVAARYFPEPVAAGDQLVHVIQSGPDERWEAIHHVLFTAITQARRSVLLTTPYFVPDGALEVALGTAALRGVDVRLLIPRRSDSRILDYTARSFLPDLVRAGVRVFEYETGMMHAKTAVVDGEWSTVGSANMDVRSFRLNFEANLVVYGREFAAGLEEAIARDLREAGELGVAWLRNRRYRDRLLSGAGRVLAPVL